jgi:hypothetical protein
VFVAGFNAFNLTFTNNIDEPPLGIKIKSTLRCPDLDGGKASSLALR